MRKFLVTTALSAIMAASGARAEQSPKPIDLTIALRCESLSDYTGHHITVSIEEYKKARAESDAAISHDSKIDVNSLPVNKYPYRDLFYTESREISFSHGVGDPNAEGLIISAVTPNIISIDTDSNDQWSRYEKAHTWGSIDRHTGAGTLYYNLGKIEHFKTVELLLQCEPAPAAKF